MATGYLRIFSVLALLSVRSRQITYRKDSWNSTRKKAKSGCRTFFFIRREFRCRMSVIDIRQKYVKIMFPLFVFCMSEKFIWYIMIVQLTRVLWQDDYNDVEIYIPMYNLLGPIWVIDQYQRIYNLKAVNICKYHAELLIQMKTVIFPRSMN